MDLNNAMLTHTLKDTNSLHKSRIYCKEDWNHELVGREFEYDLSQLVLSDLFVE